MAEGYARDLGGSFLEVYSAGIHPTGIVSKEAVRVMDERNIDITRQRSKGLDEVPLDEMDYVVSLAGRPARSICPTSFAGVPIDWEIDDPIGGPVEYYRAVRDEIGKRVKELVEQLLNEGAAPESG